MLSLNLALFGLALFANNAIAGPVLAGNDGLMSRSVYGLDSQLEIRNYTENEIHANILARWPPQWTTTSDELIDFVIENLALLEAAPETQIYLTDVKEAVTIDNLSTLSEAASNGTLSARGRDEVCIDRSSRRTKATHAYWYPWRKMTGCLTAVKSDAGGEQGLAFTNGIAYSLSIGFDIGPFKELFSASAGFSVEWSFSETRTITCYVNPGGRASVWEKHRMAWIMGEINKCTQCNTGGGNVNCKGWADAGWANVAANSKKDNSLQEWGCSTGSAAMC